VGGDAGDVQASGAVFEEYPRVQALAEHSVDVDEVCCDDAVGLVGEELAPGRTGAARLYRSKSHRCTSSRVTVLVDESIEDAGA
jgi:hypothetical protein